MKSFSDFKTIRKEVKDQNVRDQYYREEIYKVGEWVLTEKDNVGKIIRRGPNYVICLTAEDTKFRTWVKDIKEVFEIGTDAYRQYVMSLTPGQKVQKPKGTEKVNQVIPTDPKKDKMDNHESLVQAAVKALNEYSPVPPVKKTPVGTEGTANKNPKGTGGAKGIGGGDAPGMKMAEPKGTKGKPSIKKPKHACATKVEHPEWGAGNCLKEQHTLDEDGTVTHYDVMFDHGLEKDVPVETLNIKKEGMHEHVARPEQQTDRNQVETELDQKVMVEPPLESVGEGKDHKKKKGKGKFWQDSDGDGKWYEDEDIKKEENVAEGKKGLWDNIHAKRKRGEKPAKKGDKDYPKTLNVEGSMKTARKNVGASTCWDGYKAKGTKKKGGKTVPNCVKEFSEWRKLSEKK